MKLATPINPCNVHSMNPNQLATATWKSQDRPTKPADTSLVKCSTAPKNTWRPAGPLHRSPSTSGQCLRDKWMEFQGIRNWEGLLDPLDDRLRNEILRYGEFVEAAYRSFDSDTSSPTYASCPHPEASMLSRSGTGHNKGYKVTRYLHATCGVHLPESWNGRIPGWVSCRSSWIGYVAVCTDEQEIARLGRRDVVVAYRGTVTCMEWVENLRATLTCLLDHMSPGCPSTPMVQSGLLSMYTSSSDKQPSLRDVIREEIGNIIREYADEPLSITVTGHSLGAALAVLTAHDITRTFHQKPPLVTVVSFGGPRVGNNTFRRQLERSGAKVLRIVNSDDPVTKVPGFVMDEKATWLSEWVRRRVEGTQWVYAEIGNELRLSSRRCPHLNTGRSVAMCHNLRTYLQLVDNFVSSELSSCCKCHASDQ